jgi:transcriptional regulator with XRE-family HTH domain
MHKKGGTEMCTLYDRIQTLCKIKGVSGSRMCLDLGLSKSTLSDIKSGRKKGVSTATAQKIASYFDVSVGYLLGEEEKEKPTAQEGDRLSDLQREIMTIVQDAPEDLQKEFLNYLLFSKAQREK